MIRLLSRSLLAIVVLGSIDLSAEPAPVRSQLVAVDATHAEFIIYRQSERRTVSFSDLEIWPNIPPDQHPLRFFYDGDTDYRQLFLENGFARLKEGVTGPPELVAAQDRAKTQQVGMWAPPRKLESTSTAQTATTATATASSTTTAEPEPAPTPPEPSWWSRTWTWIAGDQARGLAVQMVRSIVLVVGFFGAFEFIGVFIRWRRRFRVDVIFFGQISVGKTWLWLRTVHPNVSATTLEGQRPTQGAAAKKLHRMPMGDYTMRPVFNDLPGSRPGAQLTQLLDRRRFWRLQNTVFPQKRVWVISLASTIDKSVTRESAPEKRVNRDHLTEQYGSLVLYEAALREPHTHKPALVVICITKADLFADDEDALKPGRLASTEISKVFFESVRRLETVCKEEHVRCVAIITSARLGWGCENFVKGLRDAFYPPERAA
jgi:hypothetical protein